MPQPAPNTALFIECVSVRRSLLLLLSWFAFSLSAFGQLTLAGAGPATGNCGDVITVQITAPIGYNNLNSLQFSVLWDTTQLEYLGHQEADLGGSLPLIGTSDAGLGELGYSWFNATSTSGINVPDGTLLLTIELEIISAGSTAAVLVGSTIEATDATTLLPIQVGVANNASIVLLGPCAPAGGFTIAGALATEAQQGISDAFVQLVAAPASGPAIDRVDLTDSQGSYGFAGAVPAASDFTLTPFKNDNPLNGVSTYDLIRISRHILAVEPLTSPYQLIAADINNSGSVTSADLIDLRQLILGLVTEFPGNTSWRFVDRAYVFPDASNPFAPPFPESIAGTGLAGDVLTADFVGVKIGDVNGTVLASGLQETEDRTSAALFFELEDRTFEAGEVFDATFRAAERVQGYQLTLQTAGLEVLDVHSTTPGLTAVNFAVFDREEALTTSYDGAAEPVVFTVRFRARRAGRLSEMLAVSSRIARAEAYGWRDGTNGTSALLAVALRFADDAARGPRLQLYANEPNPWSEETRISFYLPAPGEVVLRVWDETGRPVHRQHGEFEAGEQTFVVEGSALKTCGRLYYQLGTAGGVAVGKMVKLK
jgi:hypothetical protein